MGMERKVELLAPAGNYESFLAAIHGGADAVYLGGEKFGARAYADNFSEEELCGCIRYAHLYGRKVYLTLNTLVKEKEMAQLFAYLKPFYEAGLDGVIIQDMGVFSYVKEQFPGLSLHVSTQMAITGVHGAEKLKQLGAERIVPARELSLEEIRLIKEKVNIEIETFIHGAMCYCYSGMCLFSSILGGRSGNRGKCAQPCRLPYRIGGKKEREAYYLSLKDMCTIEWIPELIEAGIDSFKIEGRMKKPEYAAGVTALYRKYIDLYYEKGAQACKVSKADLNRLKSLYIRSEIQDGYYKRHNGAAMVTVEKPSYSGSNEQLLQELRERYVRTMPPMAVRGKATLRQGQPAVLVMEKDGVMVTVQGKMVQEALKQPLPEENIHKQLEKCGGTPFYMECLLVEMDERIFMPLKELNELRREGLEQLENKIIAGYGLDYPERKGRAGEGDREKEQETCENIAKCEFEDGIYVTVQTKEQLAAVSEVASKVNGVFISTDIYELEEQQGKKVGIKENAEYIQTKDLRGVLPNRIFAAYPYVMRTKDCFIHSVFEKQELFDGILVRNMETMGLLQNARYGGKIITDACLYQWNRRAEQFFCEEADLCTFPIELNGGERKNLDGRKSMQVVYGRLPMMITANCVEKTSGRCHKMEPEGAGKARFVPLIDRMGKELPVYIGCRHCTNVIYNSVPLSLHSKVGKAKGKYRLDFTTESGQETKQIIQYFNRLYEGAQEAPVYKDYTTGHEKRGAE